VPSASLDARGVRSSGLRFAVKLDYERTSNQMALNFNSATNLRRYLVILSFLAADVAGALSVHGDTSAAACPAIIRAERDERVDYFKLADRPDAYGMTSPFTAKGEFRQDLAPDTLYAWMSEAILKSIFANSNPSALLKDIGRPYYLWRTPMGSFGYGAVSIRLKLKSGVRFALIPHIHPMYSDYTARVEALKKQFDLSNTVFVSEIPIAVPITFDNRVWDRNGLIHRIEHMKKLVSDVSPGKILFSQGVAPAREDHFQSRIKPYWERP
jgi:hypothetical protein